VSGDGDRTLGVVECFHIVLRQCPSGAVHQVAEQGLAAIERGGGEALAEQAFLLLSAARGWRGPRADQVKRSLEVFLAERQA